MAANDTEIPEISNLDLNALNFDSSEFWKSRDEKEQNSLNEKLLEISRNGPSDAFTSVLQKEQQSPSSSNYIDLDIVDKSGWSPLIHAAFNGHCEIVKEILLHQEMKYKQEFQQETTENQAIEEKSKELKSDYHFRKFLRRKVKWNGSTALHLSCARGHESIVKLLINKMVNDYKISLEDSINAIDDDLATPLHCAVLGRHYKICEILLMNGSITNKCDIRGKTPMDWAHERGLNDYVALLRRYQPQTETLQTLEMDLDSINDDISSKVVESIWEEQERKSMEPCNEATNSWNSSLPPSSSPTPPEAASCEPIPSPIEVQYNQNVTPVTCFPSESNTQFSFDGNTVNSSPSTHYPDLSAATPNNTPHANANNPWYPPQSTMNNPPQTHAPNHHHPQQQQHNYQQYSHFHGHFHQNQQYQNQQHYNQHSHRMRAPRHIRYQQQRFGYQYQQQQQQQQQQQCTNNVNMIYPPRNRPYPLHRHQSLSPPPTTNNLPNNMPSLTISKSWDPQSVVTSDVVQIPSKVDSIQETKTPTPSKSAGINNDDNKLEETAENNTNTKIRDKIIAAKQEQEKEEKPKVVAVDDELKESDPTWDVMKFQNKYLEARCESLEKEKKELMTQYKRQLHAEAQKYETRESLLMEQLEGKKRQIRDLRHTMRQMRHFLDSLPVRIRRKFYRDHGNFSRRLYDQQQQHEGNVEQTKDEAEDDENGDCDECQGSTVEMRRNPSQQQQEQDKNQVQCTTNGWKTIITEHLREDPERLSPQKSVNDEVETQTVKNEKEEKDKDGDDGNDVNGGNGGKVERNYHGNNGGFRQRNWSKRNNKNVRSKRYYNNSNQRKYGNNLMSMDSDTSWRRKR